MEWFQALPRVVFSIPPNMEIPPCSHCCAFPQLHLKRFLSLSVARPSKRLWRPFDTIPWPCSTSPIIPGFCFSRHSSMMTNQTCSWYWSPRFSPDPTESSSCFLTWPTTHRCAELPPSKLSPRPWFLSSPTVSSRRYSETQWSKGPSRSFEKSSTKDPS